MAIRELHGIDAGPPGYAQTIHVADGTDAVIVAMTNVSQVTITADEARFLARLLEEAADRVSPLPEQRALVASDPEGIPPISEPFIAVRKPKPPKVWTPERNELMRVEVPLGRLTREELKAALEALPGPPIPNVGRLGTQAHTLGLTWGPPPQAAPAASEAAQEPVPEQLEGRGGDTTGKQGVIQAGFTPDEMREFVEAAPGVSAVPADARHIPTVQFATKRTMAPDVIAMDFEQVKALASRWGVHFGSWDDLPPVNHKAETLGHPRIERRYVLPRKLHNLDAD